MRRGLSSFIHKGRKQLLPARVHSWLHSYPHATPKRGQAIYLEINGKGRMWTTKKQMIRELGNDGFVLFFRDENDTYQPLGEMYE